MTLIQHLPLRGAELEGEIIAAVSHGCFHNHDYLCLGCAVCSRLSPANPCPFVLPQGQCDSVSPVIISEGKPTSHLLKKHKQAYSKSSELINAILVFCRDCGLAG